MALLSILTYPDPRLKQVSEAVASLDDLVRQLICDLNETLEHHQGCVGVAAPQTGNQLRIVVIDASRNRKPVENHGRQVLINPVIEKAEGSCIAREGCLSLPDFTANVTRAASIACRFLDADFNEQVIATDGFEARVILHEIDHLDGLLFLDRVSSLKTDVFRRKRFAAPDAVPGVQS